MEKLYLLDAYALIFRAYYGFIKSPRINSKGQNTSAVLGFVNTLEEVLRSERPDYIGVAFDPKGGTFRHRIFPAYKAQREETPEGIRFAVPYIKDILSAYHIPVLEVPDFEADDVIGTLSRRFANAETEVYMVTPDKDYGQLVRPGVWMLRPQRGGTEQFERLGTEEICAKYGIENTEQVIDLLGLMGDSADNIPGCPGVGEKTAAKLIQQFGGIEQLLTHTAELKGALRTKVETNAEQIRFSKMLATIRTDVPLDIELSAFATAPKDTVRLTEIFDELEFHQLKQRVLGLQHSPTPPSSKPSAHKTTATAHDACASGMGNLFDTPTPAASPANPSAHEQDLFASVENAQKTSIFSGNTSDLFSESRLSSIKNVNHSYYLVEKEEEMRDLCQKLISRDFFVLDTETTSTVAVNAELVGLSFVVDEGVAYYVPVPADRGRAQEIVEIFRPAYEHDTLVKIGQNLKYDISVLANYGIEMRGPMFDTMVAHYLLWPDLQQHGMDYMAETLLNYSPIPITALIGTDKKKQISMRDVADLSQVCEYAAEDADVTLRLFRVLQPRLEDAGLARLFRDIEMPLVPVLARMERNGVKIDTESLRRTSLDFTSRMTALEREIHAQAGETFNISSPQQVGHILFEKLRLVDKPKKTPTGQYSTSEEVLKSLRGSAPIVDKILEYRGYKKLLSTYVDALPRLINPHTGHIHTSYNQTVVSTGRLSSSNPNLQNIPVRTENGKEVRQAFIPDSGEEFFSADYSQIELRIIAHLSNDEHMIAAFREGDDIHRATAARLYKVPLEEVTTEQRRKAKSVNFGLIYGMTTFGLAERTDISRAEAKSLIDDYFSTYPDVHRYMEKSVETARERGYTVTLFGRRLPLRDILSHNATVRGLAERLAINAPIQGTAADIIKIAMSRIDRRMRKEGLHARMILQVHDELNFSVPADEKAQLQRIVKEEMEGACALSVPLIADCGWGRNWLEAH